MTIKHDFNSETGYLSVSVFASEKKTYAKMMDYLLNWIGENSYQDFYPISIRTKTEKDRSFISILLVSEISQEGKRLKALNKIMKDISNRKALYSYASADENAINSQIKIQEEN